MDNSIWILAAGGVLGILIHNLKNMNDINKRNNGNFLLRDYLRLEYLSILLSACVVAVALIASQEIKKIQTVSEYLVLSFVAIGYMAQSIVISFAGKAEKYLNKD